MAMSLKIPAIAAAALGFGLFMVAPSEGATLPASLPTLVQPSAAAPITVGYRRWYGGGYGGGYGRDDDWRRNDRNDRNDRNNNRNNDWWRRIPFPRY